MTRWFRFYDDTLNDPKILRLSDKLYRAWTMLLCFASKNNGVLPCVDDMAASLRTKPSIVSDWVEKLAAIGLIDRVGDHFEPHNWNGRQYKSDKPDHTAAERMRNYRERKKTSAVTVTPVTHRNAVTVTVPRTETDSETEQNDKIEEGASVFTEGSKKLADAFWQAMGFESPLHIPPEYAGVDWRAIAWECAGWTDDLIAAEVRRIGPDKALSYYEKVFATSFAKRQAPLPIVEIREADKLTVTHGTAKNQSGSLLAAIDRELAKVKREEDADPPAPTYPVLRISN